MLYTNDSVLLASENDLIGIEAILSSVEIHEWLAIQQHFMAPLG